MKSGIYKIENMINKKYYIGQSEDLESRIKEHKYLMNKLKENNKKLNNDIIKYGIDNFEIHIIEFCKVEELDEKEKKYIELYNSIENGYNTRIGGYEGRKYKKDNNRIRRCIFIEENKWKALTVISRFNNRSNSNMLEFLIDDYCKKNPLTTDLNAKTIKIEKWEKGE